MRRSTRASVAITAATITAACAITAVAGGPATGATASAVTAVAARPAAAGFPAAAWPTYDQNAARTGIASSLAPVGPLSVAWRARLDGAVYGQPLLIGTLVVVATENDTVYALDAATGAIAWQAHVASPVPQSALHGCGDIFPLGITGTPAYDPRTGLVYAVAETSGPGAAQYRHVLFGLSVADGHVAFQRYIPTPDHQEAWDQQRPALTISDARVYVAFGGLAGDCGPYQGSVVAIPESGAGELSYLVPTAREGAIWAPGGPVRGPDGSLYVSNGNGAAGAGDAYDYSDAVTRLSPGLQRLDFFAPSTWAADNADDHDLGSTPPALAAGGTVVIVGKSGTGYLLRAAALGGIGGEVAQAPVCQAYGTAAVNGSTVYEPCTDTGLTAVTASAPGKTLAVVWRGPAGAHGSPAIGGGAIWVPDSKDGILYALDPATGAVLQSVSLGDTMPRFSSVSLAGARAYVGTVDGVVAVSGA